MTALHHQPAQSPYGLPTPPPRGGLRRGWLVTGTTMIVLAVLLPLTVIALVWDTTEAADERAEELAPGIVGIAMRAGHAYDVLTAAPGVAVDTCHVGKEDGSGTTVQLADGTSRWGTEPDEGERGDGLPPGEWFVAGHFTGPYDGPVTVGCDGSHAAGELTLMPDDDSYGAGGLAVLGGIALLLAGIGALLVGLLWRKPAAAPAYAMAPGGGSVLPLPPGYPPHAGAGYAPQPGYPAQPAAGYGQQPAGAAPLPWDQQREPAPWEGQRRSPQPPVAPAGGSWQPQQQWHPEQQWQPPQQEWQPRQWEPPQWTPPGADGGGERSQPAEPPDAAEPPEQDR
jgi:hypothetical protein